MHAFGLEAGGDIGGTGEFLVFRDCKHSPKAIADLKLVNFGTDQNNDVNPRIPKKWDFVAFL